MRIFVVCALALLGCGPLSGSFSHKQPGPKGDSPVDMAQPVDFAPPGDLNCGGMQLSADRVPPNVMLVLDRSGSMGNTISAASTTSKWDDLKTALSSLITTYDPSMRFGVSLFSSDGNCGAGQINAPATMNGTSVMGKVNASSPAGNTPTAGTMQAVI